MRNNKLLLTGSIVVAAALGLTACGSSGDSADEQMPPSIEVEAPEATETQPEATETAPETETETSGDLHENTVSAIAAIDLAESETGGVAYQLSDDDDESHWEVDLNVDGTEVEVRINWAGTEIINRENDDAVDADKLQKLDAATLTIQDAIKAASPHAGGYVDDAELDEENGVVTWEIQFEDGPNEWEVYVNAQTGEIIKVEND